jgi:hypothetical protein
MSISLMPNTSVPIDYEITIDGNIRIYRTNRLQLFRTPSTLFQNNDFQTAIINAPQWQRYLLQHYRIHDLDDLIQFVTSVDSKMYPISDGRLKDQEGSFGVSAETNDIQLYRIQGPALGFNENANWYHSEAYGLLAGVNFLCLFLKTYQIQIPPNCQWFMFSDNLSLVL